MANKPIAGQKDPIVFHGVGTVEQPRIVTNNSHDGGFGQSQLSASKNTSERGFL